MTRYNAIHKINDTWGSYEEKGKTPQWVNLKTGERYNIKNKETFTEFLKRLKETETMTLKTISDQPKTFTFTYDFSDIDTAQVASHAILGYMTGTYHAPAIDSTIKGGGQLVLEYAEDSNLNKIFKRICDSFKDYYTTPEEIDTVKEQYRLERVEQLKQSETFDSRVE